MAEQAHNSNTSATLSNEVQVNQLMMDILCRAGLAQPQPINGPGDGDPQYLIPRATYMRYMGPMSGVNVNDPPIDPSLFQNHNSTPPPQQTSQCPKPCPWFGQHRRVVPTSMSTAVASAGASTAAVSYQPLTPPPSQPLVNTRRDRKSTRLNSSHLPTSRMPSSA